MKIKIISDGKSSNTHVINIETGERLEGVKRIDWHLEAPGLSKCTLTLYNIPVEVKAGNLKKYELSNENSNS